MVTVQDILQIPVLDLRLLAGMNATGNHVRWVHVAEVPQTMQNLRGGEVLLTAGEGLTSDAGQQAEYIASLADLNLAGLGFATGFAFDEVPPALAVAAEECGMPLFEIPRHVALSAITEAVTSRIVNQEYSHLQRSLAIHEKLTKIVLEEQGLHAILATLSALVDCSAVLFDFHGIVLCETSARRGLAAETVGEFWTLISNSRARRGPFFLELEGTGPEAQIFPVIAAHRIGAFLAVIKDRGGFTDYDDMVLQNVVTAIALELVKKKAVVETEKRLVGDFLDQLVASGLSEDEISRRLTFFGLDPQAAHAILVVDARKFGGRGETMRENAPVAVLALPERLHATVDEFMAEHRLPCISASRGGRVVILLQTGERDEGALRGLADALLEWVREDLPEASVSLGIGRPHARLDELRRSYYEASYAIRIRHMKDDTGFVADYGDLGSYMLLLGLQDTPSLAVFSDSLLGRLAEHDRENGSDLLASLACFLEANGHWGDAADKLFVHRHTLRYRMKRVQEITGRDLSQPQDRMEFWLALKAQEFLEGTGDRGSTR